MLEGISAIAAFIGKSPNTVVSWILNDGLPATKTRQGRWLSHKGLILQWIYAGHQAEVRHRAGFAVEPETIDALAERMGVSAEEVRSMREAIYDSDHKEGKKYRKERS